MSVSMRSLPVVIRRAVPTARLPDNYLLAKQAIEECAEVDQVKDWHDKSAALATYAREAGDSSLLFHAKRIQVRAAIRVGELLNEIRQQQGGSKRKALDKTGLPATFGNVVMRAAEIPRDLRERDIENEPPSSVYELVSSYSTKRATCEDWRPRPCDEFRKALNRFCLAFPNVDKCLKGVGKLDVPVLRTLVRDASELLDEVDRYLEAMK